MSYYLLTSDTHMPGRGKSLPSAFSDLAKDAKAILHTGDFTEMSVVHELESYAPLYGVQGNNDSWEVMSHFPAIRIVSLEGARIGMAHGHFGRSRTTPERAREHFSRNDVDLIVFGHSHIPFDQEIAGVRCVNAGSLCDPRKQPAPTFVVLRLLQAADGWSFDVQLHTIMQ